MIFAVAEEPGMEGLIVSAALSALDRGERIDSLVDVLVAWSNPKIMEQFAGEYAKRRFKEPFQVRQWRRLTSSAFIDVPDQEMASLEGLRAGHPIETIRRAALIVFDAREGLGLRGLREQVEQAPPAALMQTIAETRNRRFLPVLDEVVARLVRDPAPDDIVADERTHLATEGVTAIVRLGGKVVPDVADDLFDRVRVYSDYQRLARALLKMGDPACLGRLSERLGPAEVDRLLSIQNLRPIPDDPYQYQMLPRSSRGWVWSSYMFRF